MDVLLTPEDVTVLDREMVRHHAISETDLMEMAATAVYTELLGIIDRCVPMCHTITVVCGNGNNGGDGFCLARMLSDTFSVHVVWSGSVDALSPSAKLNYLRLPSNVATSEVGSSPACNADLVVDAVLGVGARLPLREPAIGLITFINQRGSPVVSIDVPSGLDARTGAADNVYVCAGHTITFEREKVGMLRLNGPVCSGDVHVVSFGIPEALLQTTSRAGVLEPADIRLLLPNRTLRSSKFDYGRVVVIGGTKSMRGAPSLAAHAALALGAGIVDLVAPAIHPLTPREIITHEIGSHTDGSIRESRPGSLDEILSRATTIAIGPGLGTNEETIQLVADCVNRLDPMVPVVVDADGLRCLPLLRERHNMILTPHMGEFARILGVSREQLEPDYVERAEALARDRNYIVHVKHVPSITTNGHSTTYLRAGNPAMATAGSGDILTGMIAAFAAQGCSAFDAARLGAFVHASAGDRLSMKEGRRSAIAHELISAARQIVGSTEEPTDV